MIFSGGMPAQTDTQQTLSNSSSQTTPSKPSSYFLTIVRGQTTNVLHMDNAIVDFHVVTPSPHIAGRSNSRERDIFLSKITIVSFFFFVLDVPDPSAVVVLLENDLVVIDLKSEK